MNNFDLKKYLAEGKLYENLFGAKSEQFGKGMIANLVSDGNKVELVDNFNDVPDEFKKRPDADILAMYGGLKLKQPNKKFIQPEITIAVKGDKEAEEIIKEYPKTYIPDSRFDDKGTIVWLYFAPEDEIKKGQIDPLAEGKLNALAQGKVNIKEPFTETKLIDLLNEVIKDKSDKRKEIEIDLTGPDGNAFALLGYASKFAKQLNLDFNKIKNEMTSGDYENLVSTFDKYFGSFVTLYR